MTHNYSLRSAGPVEPSYTEALNRNLIELSGLANENGNEEQQPIAGSVQNDTNKNTSSQNEESKTRISQTEACQTNPCQEEGTQNRASSAVACQTDSGESSPSQSTTQNVASQINSSEVSLNANQTHNGSNRKNMNQCITQSKDESSQTDGANITDSNLNATETELQELRIRNSQYKENIKILMQELNTRDETIRRTNEKLNTQMASVMNEFRPNTCQRAIPKLPDFSGGSDDNIEVWITQFDESLHFLSNDEKDVGHFL